MILTIGSEGDLKLTRWHLHHTLEIDGKVFYRFNEGFWYEKLKDDWREIVSLKEEAKLEKMFEEAKGESKG